MKRLLFLVLLLIPLQAYSYGRVLLVCGEDRYGSGVQTTAGVNVVVMRELDNLGVKYDRVYADDTLRIDVIRRDWGTISADATYPGDYRYDMAIFLNLYANDMTTAMDSPTDLLTYLKFPQLAHFVRRTHVDRWPGRVLLPFPIGFAAVDCWAQAHTGVDETAYVVGANAYAYRWWKWTDTDSVQIMSYTQATSGHRNCWVVDERDTTGVTGVRRLVWTDTNNTRSMASRLCHAWFTYAATGNHGVYWVPNAQKHEASWIINAIIAAECDIKKPALLSFGVDLVGYPSSTAAMWGNTQDSVSTIANIRSLVEDVLVPYKLKLEMFWGPRYVYDNTRDMKTLFANVCREYPQHIRPVLNSYTGSWHYAPQAIMGQTTDTASMVRNKLIRVHEKIDQYFPGIDERNTIYAYYGIFASSWAKADSIIDVLYDLGYRYIVAPQVIERVQPNTPTLTAGNRVYSSSGKSLLIVPVSHEIKYLVANSSDGTTYQESDSARMAYCNTVLVGTTIPRIGNAVKAALLNVFGLTIDTQAATVPYTNPLVIESKVWPLGGAMKISFAFFNGGDPSKNAGIAAKYPQYDPTNSTAKAFLINMGKIMRASEYISTTYGLKKNTPMQCIFTDEYTFDQTRPRNVTVVY